MCDPCYPCYSYSCKSCTKYCHTGSCRCCKCRPCGRTHSKCPYCTSSCYSYSSCHGHGHGSEDVQILDENGKPIKCECDPCDCCCYCKEEPKEMPVKKCKSRELRASVLYVSCDCIKHNGLQDQCRRRGCRDKSGCTMKPLPICCPSDKPLKFMFKTMGMTCYQKNKEGSRGKRCKIVQDEDDVDDDETSKDMKSLMCCVACFPGAGTGDACKFSTSNDYDDDTEGWIACKPYCCT